MSLRYEQIRAIEQARDLIRDIVTKPASQMPRSLIRIRAAAAWRHFPVIDAEGVIHWSNDDIPRPPELSSGEVEEFPA